MVRTGCLDRRSLIRAQAPEAAAEVEAAVPGMYPSPESPSHPGTSASPAEAAEAGRVAARGSGGVVGGGGGGGWGRGRIKFEVAHGARTFCLGRPAQVEGRRAERV